MSLDAEIRAAVMGAVIEAVERAARSKECMNAEEARAFLGLTKHEFDKRRHLIPRREESARKNYWLREDLLEYLRSLPRVPDQKSDYPSDYGGRLGAAYGSDRERFSA